MSVLRTPFREPLTQLKQPVERVAGQLLVEEAGIRVRQPPVLREPGIEVDDTTHAPGTVVGDHHEVTVQADGLTNRTDCLVEMAVDRGHPALHSLSFPLQPAVVLDVVGRHEDHEQQVWLEALRQPEAGIDSLPDRSAHPLDVDVPVAVERQLVVEHELVVTTAKIGEQRVRIGEPALTRSCVDAGDEEPVHLGSRPREGHVDDADGATCGRQMVPDRRSPTIASVHHSQPVTGLVPLAEVPHPVATGVDAGEHRRPRLCRQRMGRRAQDAPTPGLEDLGEVGELPRFDHRIDDVERRRVQADDRQSRTVHSPP